MSRAHRWLKLSHHGHTYKLRPHEHTSYGPLLALLAVVGVALTIGTVTAATPYDGPESGSVGLTGQMPGKPPTEAAVITAPTNGQRISTSPTTVKGTCPANLLVQVYKNDIFAGSGPCSDKGDFQFDVDLLIGQNILIARIYDDLNQPGPDSEPVTVFYDALPPQAGPLAGLNFGSQLMLNTDAVFRGLFPDKEHVIPVTILGGIPPYALNIQWGDSTNRVVPRNDNLTFKVGHTYKRPGIYQITMQATDAQGRVAFLSVAAIVNGQPGASPAAAELNAGTANRLLALWPLYTASVAVIVSFWLGERREKKILGGDGPVYR